jgi:choline dehydrogenase-like flavoprotein
MLEGEYDLDYRSAPQRRGNDAIRHARARILGGCSSHNTMIALRPPDRDFDEWEALGAAGWGAAAMQPYFDRLQTPIVPVAPEHRNPYLADVVQAAASALAVPVRESWNDSPYADGAGFLPIGYDPATGIRSSSSISYLHPVMDRRSNLDVLLATRALRVLVDPGGRATGVLVRGADGASHTVAARREVVLCCGAVDTPRLLLLSGIGPADSLRELGIEPVADVPGVGEHLTDHPEALLVWQARRPIPAIGATDWDITIMARVDAAQAAPEILAHVPLMTYAVHAEALGLAVAEHSISMTPNVCRPRSRGRVSLASADPEEPPVLDPRYFSDADGYDERMLVQGIRLARRVAATEPMAGWIEQELFPGPDVTSEQALSRLGRATHHTVYHLACTCRIGNRDDPLAVLDPELRVRGVPGLSVADASAFPSLTTVNPVVAVLMLAERAAELVASRCGDTVR